MSPCKLAELDALNQQLGLLAAPLPPPGEAPAPAGDGGEGGGGGPRPDRERAPKPTGRRALCDLDMPADRIELTDPDLEGTAARMEFEDSFALMWRRAGLVRLNIARVKYRLSPSTGPAPDAPVAAPREPVLLTAPAPPHILPRSLGTPSLYAHLLNEKFCYGMPFHRQNAAERVSENSIPHRLATKDLLHARRTERAPRSLARIMRSVSAAHLSSATPNPSHLAADGGGHR